jgi:oligopeptide transport system substrate-binding protein
LKNSFYLKKGGSKMKKQFIIKALVLMLAVGLVLTGCNFTGSDEASTDEGTNNQESNDQGESNDQEDAKDNGDSSAKSVFNMTASSEIPTMDSVHAHDAVAFTVLNNVNEGLYRLGQDHNPTPGMAEAHDVSEDGLTHTFTLRDAKWSNGDPVTAHDFEYAWKRIFEEAGHYNVMFETAGVLNATEIIAGEKSPEDLGVKALDEKTLEVTLSSPNPLLKSLLTFPVFLPQNQAFVESQGDQYALEAANVLYNGPFVLADWKHEQSWTYKKNPDYWDADTVKMDEINVFVVKEDATLLNLYETGKLDRIGLSSASVDQYRDDPNFKTQGQFGIVFLRFNHNHPALGNKHIRLAINMAMDKKGLTDVILNNGATPMYGHVPFGFSTSPDGKGFRELNGDLNKGTPEEAQEHFNMGLSEIGQDSATVSIMVADNEDSKKIAEYLKNQFETNIDGLTVEIKSVPFQQRLELEKAVDYDISVSTWGPDYNDPMTYIDMWITDGPANRMDYSNPEFDALVDKIRTETNESERYQMMLEAEKMVFEDAAIAPLYQRADVLLHRPQFKDVIVHPSGPDFSFKWMYVE